MPILYPSTDRHGRCIFCAIAAGTAHTPGVFWEDEAFMAFLSLWPNTEGFSVVIPKTHYDSDVLAMPDAMLQRFILAAKTVSRILIASFDDVGRVGMITEGTGVDHAHIKLVPLHGTGYMKGGSWRQHFGEQEQFYPTYPGYISSSEGPRVPDRILEDLADDLRVTQTIMNFITSVTNNEFIEAHEILEDSWMKLKKKDQSDEARIQKGLINAATAIGLLTQKHRPEAARTLRARYAAKYPPLLTAYNGKHAENYRHAAQILDAKWAEFS